MCFIAMNERLDFLRAYIQLYGEPTIRAALQVPDSYGRYPLHFAAANENSAIVHAFCTLAPAVINQASMVINV